MGDTVEESLNTVSVYMTRLRIDRQIGPSHAMGDDIGEEDVESDVSQKHFSGFQVQRHDAFLLAHAFTGAVDNEHSALVDERSGTRSVWRLPQYVFTAWVPGIR